jgi:transcriptional regulator with XRE-family HTH domain
MKSLQDSVNNVDDGAYQAGKLVYKLRKVYGLTQLEMGLRCHMRQTMIARIENGEYYPTVKTLERICKAFGKKLVIDFRE